MKAIIMEMDNKNIIVLTKNGEFKKIKRKLNNITIGDEITIPAEIGQWNSLKRRGMSIAAAVIMLLSSIGVAYAYTVPYAYLDIEINPKIRLVYNVLKRVIAAEGINEDGIELMKDIKAYKHKPIDKALDQIIQKARESSYILKNMENEVVIVIDETKIDEAKLEKKMKKNKKTRNIKIEIVTYEKKKNQLKENKEIRPQYKDQEQKDSEMGKKEFNGVKENELENIESEPLNYNKKQNQRELQLKQQLIEKINDSRATNNDEIDPGKIIRQENNNNNRGKGKKIIDVKK